MLSMEYPGEFQNISTVCTDAMKYLHNYFWKGQLGEMKNKKSKADGVNNRANEVAIVDILLASANGETLPNS